MKNFLKKLFGIEEKQEKQENETDVLLDKYLSTKKDIDYLESKWQDYVLRSLELELENYKESVDRDFPYYPKINNWKITEFRESRLIFEKRDNNGYIKIKVDYSFYNAKWESKHVFANVQNGELISLEDEKFSDIIFQYFIYWKVKEIEKEKERKKQYFQEMIDIIGKDVKRDSLIDQILSGE